MRLSDSTWMRIKIITMFTTGLMVAVFLGFFWMEDKFSKRGKHILQTIAFCLIFFLGGALFIGSLFLYEKYQYLTVPALKIYLGKKKHSIK